MRALDSEDNYNLLFIGPPASAKTLFLLEILELKHGIYLDGSNTESWMIKNYLFFLWTVQCPFIWHVRLWNVRLIGF